MTHTPTKAARVAAIEQCILAIADHCRVNALFILDPKPRKGMQDARALLVFHLYNCGMSFDAIARLLSRSVDSIRRLESHGAIRMMSDDKELIASLPTIPSTLNITQA